MPVLAKMVHHIKPLADYPELAYSLDNLVSLCDRCHDEAHPEKRLAACGKPPDPVPDVAKGIPVARLDRR